MALEHPHKDRDGESSPSQSDITSSALAIFKALMAQSNGVQIGLILQAVIDSLDNTNNWGKAGHCRWLVHAGVGWSLHRHRYVIPTQLVKRLLETPDSASQSIRTALTSMVIAVFTPSTLPVHTTVSDVVSNLISLLPQRVVGNTDDSLTLALVESIGLLGIRIQHADQIRDFAGELIGQLVAIETRTEPGVYGGWRTQVIRSLLAGLCRLVRATDVQSTKHAIDINDSKAPSISTAALGRGNGAGHEHQRAHSSWRAMISPEVWQGTLTLLCDRDYAVRADYARALVSYIKFGIRMESDLHTGQGGAGTTEGPAATAHGDTVARFLDVLHAYVYTLATTASHGIGTNEVNLSDYGHIRNILVAVHENLPVSAFLASVPVLLALDSASEEYREREPRRYNAIQEVLKSVRLTLGKVWNCAPTIRGTVKVRHYLLSPDGWPSNRSALGFIGSPIFTPLFATGFAEAWGLADSTDSTGI